MSPAAIGPKAGVADKVELRLAPAVETLAGPEEDRGGPASTWPSSTPTRPTIGSTTKPFLTLLRPGGAILIDNVLWSGEVADPNNNDTGNRVLRELNSFIAKDEPRRFRPLPIADGLTIARKR